MTINELRIGNYILGTSAEIYEGKVSEIKQSENGYVVSILGKCSNIPIIHCKGIPLTKEYLFRLGFNKIDRASWSGLYENERIKFWFSEKYESFALYGNRYGYDITMVYVHQLQNIYFALTGNELILKI